MCFISSSFFTKGLAKFRIAAASKHDEMLGEDGKQKPAASFGSETGCDDVLLGNKIEEDAIGLKEKLGRLNM